MEQKSETINEWTQWMQKVSESSSSDQKDEVLMNYFMAKVGIQGRCTCGIVYIEPFNSQPTDIHTFAKTMLKMLKEA
jgi:hypothetical protein